MPRAHHVVLLATAVTASILACSRGANVAPARSAAPAPEGDWTMLVYMAADDDLEQAAIDNIKEMAQSGSTDRVNVIVQIDRAPRDRNGGGFTRSPILNVPDFNSTKRLRVERGSLVELEDIGETCTCDAAPLADFIAWGLRAFPARRTALVLWDHGGATHGFGWDVTNENRALRIVDMGRGIGAGLAAAGRERFDLLGFDACLMSNLGVAYELRRYSEVFVGSEEVEPSIGWAYAPILRAMASNATANGLAREVVESFAAACRDTGAGDMATMAAFDARKLDGVVSALDDLGDQLRAKTHVAADWYPIAHARTAAEQYGAGGGEQTPYATVDVVDLAVGAGRAVHEPNRVGAAVDEATIWTFRGAARANAHGLSLTFPRQAKERLPEDDALELASRPDARWDAFLRAYLERAGADRTAPRIDGLTLAPSPASLELSANIPDDDVAEAAAVIGVSDASGALTVLSLRTLPPEVAATHTARFTWNKRLPALDYGHAPLPVTTFDEPPYLATGGHAARIVSFHGVLYRGGVTAQATTVIVHMRIEPAVSSSVIGVYRYEAGGSGSEVTVHDTDTFAPAVLTVAPDGRMTWTPSATALPFGSPSQLRLEDQPAVAGAYSVGFRITDYAANRIWNTARVSL